MWSKNPNTTLWQALPASPPPISDLHAAYSITHTQRQVRAKQAEGANLVINSYTPVRIQGDRVGALEVLRDQHIASRVCRECFASAPHTCSLNCASSDTVGFTPHICKGNHDGLWRVDGLWIGRHCLRTSQEPSSRSCWCATSISSRKIVSSVTKSRGACG